VTACRQIATSRIFPNSCVEIKKKPQIPPLRYASVGMTKGREVLSGKVWLVAEENSGSFHPQRRI
jgi:hypothetical protein